MTGVDRDAAEEALLLRHVAAKVKTALVARWSGVSAEEAAVQRLMAAEGRSAKL